MESENHHSNQKDIVPSGKNEVFRSKPIDPIEYNLLGLGVQDKHKKQEVDTSIFSDEDWDYLDELIITRGLPTNVAFRSIYESAKRRRG